MGGPGAPVGAIYGAIASTHFDVAVADPTLKRLEYVETEHDGHRVLGIIESVSRHSTLGHAEALAGHAGDERLTARVQVVGHIDARGRVQTPRTPFSPGAPVHLADEGLVAGVLGLQEGPGSAFLGFVRGHDVPVRLDLNTMAQKHVSVLAMTGSGKSYTVGVILEEFLLAKVPLVVLDPHGEYSSLRSPNMAKGDLAAMARFGIKPKSFHHQVREYAVDTALNPDAEPLRLEGMNLGAREIADLLPGGLSGGQVGILYQAVKEVEEKLPAWTLREIMDAIARNKSSARWNVINALEALHASGIFHIRGTPLRDLVRPGQCTIINLKGVPPDIQEIVAARLAHVLWEARKRDDLPPHILVLEEAHHFCPERGVGSSVSGPVLRTVASEGRKFGLGLVIISQRPAKIDKNVLSQCNTQIVLKVTNPNDLKAVAASVEGITSAAADEVQRLPVGVALVAGGGVRQPVFVDVRPRMTRHGGEGVDVLETSQAQALAEAARKAEARGAEQAKDAGWDGGSPAPPPAPPAVAAGRHGPPPAPDPPAASPGAPRAAAPASRPATPSQAGAPGASAPDGRHPPGSAKPTGAPPRPVSASQTRPVSTPPPRPLSASSPRVASARAAATPPSRPPPPPPPPSRPTPAFRPSRKETEGMLRVATRIGVAAGGEPKRVQALLESLAREEGKSVDHYVRLYVDIAHTACYVDEPACVRCPVNDVCKFHLQTQSQRQKGRGIIRRLWRS